MTVELFVFILFAILFSVSTKFLHKHVLEEADPYAYALLLNGISAIIFLPLMIVNFSLPSLSPVWLVVVVASIFWALTAVTSKMSIKGSDVSLRDPLNQSKLIWTFLLGVLFLKEIITTNRILGNLLVFIGVSLLLWHPERKLGRLRDYGVKWTLIGALFSSLALVSDKFALQYFKPEVYGFMVYLLPALILSLFLPKRIHHVSHLLRHRWKPAILAIALQTGTYYFTLRAFALADITFVYPLLQLSILLTVLGSIIFLKEREHLWQRIIATIIILAGTIIVGK